MTGLPPPETPLDRTVRLALDSGQARARLARAEAALGRVRALLGEHMNGPYYTAMIDPHRLARALGPEGDDQDVEP